MNVKLSKKDNMEEVKPLLQQKDIETKQVNYILVCIVIATLAISFSVPNTKQIVLSYVVYLVAYAWNLRKKTQSFVAEFRM